MPAMPQLYPVIILTPLAYGMVIHEVAPIAVAGQAGSLHHMRLPAVRAITRQEARGKTP